MRTRQKTPLVSVILAVDRQRERGARALASVLAQPRIDECEVLLFDFGRDRHPPLPGSDHPAVVAVPLRRGWPLGAFRAYAVSLAAAPIVAFLEEHARAGEGWLDALQHKFPPFAVALGSFPDCASPPTEKSEFMHLTSFASLRLPSAPSLVPLLPGHNTAFRREALVALEPRLPHLLADEALLHRALRDRGGGLFAEPSFRWSHLSDNRYAARIRALWCLNRSAGDAFRKSFPLSPLRRALWLGRLPLQPFVRTVRLLIAVWPSSRQRMIVLRRLPIVLCSNCLNAMAQFIGYCFGAGTAGQRFADFEMNAERLE
ncbi:MAG: hypothetical protein RMM58_09965 [Chloroflexota bacterium]|nr:hypothetical protein [Dehalococcoidia bacterium]MDW8254194.1 hypothetical protein [Chloroflexota bacterium]